MPIDPTIEPGSPDSVEFAITWPKAWGRPATPKLADGFSVVIRGTKILLSPVGDPETRLPLAMMPPGQDVNGGSDDYRVRFTQGRLNSIETTGSTLHDPVYSPAQIRVMSTYTVEVTMRPGVNWTSGPPPAITPVGVSPKFQRFVKERNVMMTLPDFILTDSFLG
ncbi:MAG TPA: hypothetical protein VN838_16415 [Bradyrhizobium sp.]|nr:hypothetical protein [Bradyrhizobium sp.]